jgi:hypothetical protein
MRRFPWTSWLSCILGFVAACSGASSDPGLSAWLRVDPAQFVPGAMPQPNGGPPLLDARVPHNQLLVGSLTEHVSGSAEVTATAVAIARTPDAGYWIVRAGVPTVDEPESPSFRAQLALARDFPVGPFTLELSAVDRAGHFGPRWTLDLSAVDVTPGGELIVALRWDNSADLDLHVQDANGVDVWANNINSGDPTAAQAGGILDFDSNADCSGDGRDAEYIRWQQTPPSGNYIVRVVTASLCDQPAAHWSVDVQLAGSQLAAASGTSVATDTRTGSGARKGVRALSFVVP